VDRRRPRLRFAALACALLAFGSWLLGKYQLPRAFFADNTLTALRFCLAFGLPNTKSQMPFCTRAQARAITIQFGLKIFFEDFLKFPSEIQVSE
jgi:hypothetical protein